MPSWWISRKRVKTSEAIQMKVKRAAESLNARRSGKEWTKKINLRFSIPCNLSLGRNPWYP